MYRNLLTGKPVSDVPPETRQYLIAKHMGGWTHEMYYSQPPMYLEIIWQHMIVEGEVQAENSKPKQQPNIMASRRR